MECEILVIYRCPGSVVSISLQGVVSLDEFNRKLATKGVLQETILSNLFYYVPSFPECGVTNEEEWENMIFHLNSSCTKVVNVRSGNFVEPSTTSLHLQPNTIGSDIASGSSSECSTLSLTLLPPIGDELQVSIVPQIDFPHMEKKNLLTASWAYYIVGVGQQFPGGVIEFRSKLVKFSIEKGRKFKFVRNTKKQVIAECAYREAHNCDWFINATYIKHNDWFCVRVYRDNHTCPIEVRSFKRFSASMISLLIVDMVKGNPSLNAPAIVQMFERDYGIDVSYKQALRAIDKAQDFIYGTHLDAYNELKWQLHNLKEVNEGSHIEFESRLVTNTEKGVTINRFSRCFVAFQASIEGFQYCRPLLSIDGTFLSGRYEGVLLSATAKDGDNGLFPVTFAVVACENKENWKWFLEQLLKFIPASREVIYVSDRNASLVSLFENEFSYLQHFYCLHHLKMNLRDRFKGPSFSVGFKESVVNKLSECARAPTSLIFCQKLEELRKHGVGIVNHFLQGLPLEKWACSFAPCERFGELTSNASESYNKWIKVARQLPITQCVDLIRAQMMEWFHHRRNNAASWCSKFCPGYQKKWDDSLYEGRHWHVCKASAFVFEFLCSHTVSVDLSKRFCDCYGWQFSGFPCAHGAWRWRYQIRKLTHPVDLGDKVYPPVTARLPGRPTKKRIMSRGEPVAKRQYKCSRCGSSGHPARSCKEPLRG